jgi:hypothetical protein
MERVEIGDVAIAYDDPYSLETYLLVMRNVLLIPSMDHNLLPPFLVREASLFLDEKRIDYQGMGIASQLCWQY